MGLFDRFRKKVKQADDDTSIMAVDGSEEADQAIADREETLRRLNQAVDQPEGPSEAASEWDDLDDEVSDPFSGPANSKERKRVARVQATKESQKHTDTPPKRGLMDSTTGRRLVESDLKFEIDLSEYHSSMGGMVISGGPVLDRILEELGSHFNPSWDLDRGGAELVRFFRETGFEERHFRGGVCNRLIRIGELIEAGRIDESLRTVES